MVVRLTGALEYQEIVQCGFCICASQVVTGAGQRGNAWRSHVVYSRHHHMSNRYLVILEVTVERRFPALSSLPET